MTNTTTNNPIASIICTTNAHAARIDDAARLVAAAQQTLEDAADRYEGAMDAFADALEAVQQRIEKKTADVMRRVRGETTNLAAAIEDNAVFTVTPILSLEETDTEGAHYLPTEEEFTPAARDEVTKAFASMNGKAPHVAAIPADDEEEESEDGSDGTPTHNVGGEAKKETPTTEELEGNAETTPPAKKTRKRGRR